MKGIRKEGLFISVVREELEEIERFLKDLEYVDLTEFELDEVTCGFCVCCGIAEGVEHLSWCKFSDVLERVKRLKRLFRLREYLDFKEHLELLENYNEELKKEERQASD